MFHLKSILNQRENKQLAFAEKKVSQIIKH